MAFKDLETRRAYYQRIKEKERERDRIRTKNRTIEQRQKRLAKQRERYRRDAANEARKQNERRYKREPYRGIGTAIRACNNGTLSVFELDQLVERRFAEGFAWLESTGRLGPRGRRIYSEIYESAHKKHLSVGERQEPSDSNDVSSFTG